MEPTPNGACKLFRSVDAASEYPVYSFALKKKFRIESEKFAADKCRFLERTQISVKHAVSESRG